MSQPQLNKTILSINHVDFSYPNRNLFTRVTAKLDSQFLVDDPAD